jgi:adenosylhomocysteine nucleosidase
VIYVVVALAAEARPLMHHFHLEPFGEVAGTPVYKRSDLALIVAGVGKHSMAVAVESLSTALPEEGHPVWLNIGVAGHRDLELGTAVIARRVTDDESGRVYELAPPTDVHLETAEVRTVTHVETRFETEALYEMEAAAFCEAVAGRTSPELVQVLKIVSDNRRSGTVCVSARQVQGLVEDNLPKIDLLVSSLHRQARRLSR